jgi:hypothetical protein
MSEMLTFCNLQNGDSNSRRCNAATRMMCRTCASQPVTMKDREHFAMSRLMDAFG